MRIGVDARELAGRATGVGRYVAELLACWSRDPAAAHEQLILFSHVPLELPDGLIGEGGARVTMRVVGGSGSVAWEQTRLGFAARPYVDVLFCPGYSGPLLPGVPLAVTLHDVSYWAHPEWFRPKEGWRRRLTSWAAAHRARRVLAVSNFSRDEIVRLLGVSAEKIRVIPQGVRGFFDPTRAGAAASANATAVPAPANSARSGAHAELAADADGARHGAELDDHAHETAVHAVLPQQGLAERGQVRDTGRTAHEASGKDDGPLVLFVGSIFNRRHVPLLMRAFAPIARDKPSLRLAIVGDNRTFPHEDLDTLAKDLGIAGQVRMTAYVSDPELATMYRQARAFAFLSTYEGFGLTPLEALAAGVPAVMFDTAVAREVFQDAALLVPPGDELGVTAALRALLDYDTVRAHCLSRGAELVESYTWTRTATLTLAAIREAAGA